MWIMLALKGKILWVGLFRERGGNYIYLKFLDEIIVNSELVDGTTTAVSSCLRDGKKIFKSQWRRVCVHVEE